MQTNDAVSELLVQIRKDLKVKDEEDVFKEIVEAFKHQGFSPSRSAHGARNLIRLSKKA